MNLLGYFWFGEQTAEGWIIENMLEASTVAGGAFLLKNPRAGYAVAKPLGAFGLTVAWKTGVAVMTTPIFKGVSLGHIGIGYGIGAVVGTTIAKAGWGNKGRDDAIDFYTDPFDADKWETIGDAIVGEVTSVFS